MNETSARRVLLVQAIETADTEGRLVSEVERALIDQQARQAAQAGAGAAPIPGGEFVDLRAQRVLAIVGERDRGIALLRDQSAWRGGLMVGVPLATMLLGALTERIADPHGVDLLSLGALVGPALVDGAGAAPGPQDRVDLVLEAPAGRGAAQPFKVGTVHARNLAQRPALVPAELYERTERRAHRGARPILCRRRSGIVGGRRVLRACPLRARGVWLGSGVPGECVVPACALDVVLAPAACVTEDLPGGVDALHLGVVAGHVGMEDLGQDAVGGLDHQRVSRRVHLQDAVVVEA